MGNRDIVFVAAENGAFPRGKVGGVGDVMLELPAAIADLGWPVSVLTPSYGTLHRADGAEELASFDTQFRGKRQTVRCWEVAGSKPGVRNLIFDHGLLASGEPGTIYHEDDGSGPFAQDANKFAFFCRAAADWMMSRDTLPAAIHLHDWHAGIVAVLRNFDPSLDSLRSVPTVFTIHNLSYQGQRPMRGDESSLEAWFPELSGDPAPIAEPGALDVFNPMAAGIRLADRVSTVSPTYAREITSPSDRSAGFIGGEGLENELRAARDEGRLVGILNGCDYSVPAERPQSWPAIVEALGETVTRWNDEREHEVHDIALERIAALPRRRPLHVLTSVGRVVEQKMRLFLEPTLSGSTALEDILANLGDSGVLLLLGSGEARYERQLADIAATADNLVYLRGYSEPVSRILYSSGDLFLMPSSFEPCGISQMLAMRDGQPCVVHGVGGLGDTVQDNVTGFVFDGRAPLEQADNFVRCVDAALRLRCNDPLEWQTICKAAAAARYDWRSSAEHYLRQLYELSSS